MIEELQKREDVTGKPCWCSHQILPVQYAAGVLYLGVGPLVRSEVSGSVPRTDIFAIKKT